MLARLDPRFLPRLWFPLGEQGKEETRAEASAAGLAAATRPESQEACFLAGGDYRDFLDTPRPREPRGAGARLGGARGWATRRFLALHARPAARPRGRHRGAGLRRANRSAHERRLRRLTRVARPSRGQLGHRPPVRPRRARGGEAPLPLARNRRRPSLRSPAASGSRSTSPPTASQSARPPCSTRTRPSSAPASSPRRVN